MTAASDRLRLVAADDGDSPRAQAPVPSGLASAREAAGEAGEQIVPHVPALAACVRALAGDPTMVEDIVHETVVQALECWRRYDPTRDLGAWLRGIAVHLVRHHWRKSRRGWAATQVLALATGAGATGPDPESALSGRRQAESLLAALDALTPKLREAFVLRVVEGLSAEDAARAVGTSPAAIHTRVCKARRLLLAAMEVDRERHRKGHANG